MNLGIELIYKTPTSWATLMLAHFDEFLVDHAANERKASATALNFVARYPDRPMIVTTMIKLAREELQHFQQVADLVYQRGLRLVPDERNPYLQGLFDKIRNGREEHFLDRLLTFGIVEARGYERFRLIADHAQDPIIRSLYIKISDSEMRHSDLFVKLALEYFEADAIKNRLNELLKYEAELIANLVPRVGIH